MLEGKHERILRRVLSLTDCLNTSIRWWKVGSAFQVGFHLIPWYKGRDEIQGMYRGSLFLKNIRIIKILNTTRSGSSRGTSIRSALDWFNNLEKRVEGWNERITRIPWGFLIGAELTIAQSRISLVNKIQKVYRSQGVQIHHNRHIEILLRQITSKVLVSEDGLTFFHPENESDCCERNEEGALWEKRSVTELGITRASLNTQSFISEASFSINRTDL